tara:strand:- start:53 stop:340 length:288 start_codon:yes stop_codon:yes gene_type:complete
MAIENITIDKFEDEKVNKDNLPDESGTLKKKVGFKVVDNNGGVFIVDKYLDIVDGKTDDEYSKDAYDLAKSAIDDWQNSLVNIGKKFNPITGKME